jgi:hypothetical protein
MGSHLSRSSCSRTPYCISKKTHPAMSSSFACAFCLWDTTDFPGPPQRVRFDMEQCKCSCSEEFRAGNGSGGTAGERPARGEIGACTTLSDVFVAASKATRTLPRNFELHLAGRWWSPPPFWSAEVSGETANAGGQARSAPVSPPLTSCLRRAFADAKGVSCAETSLEGRTLMAQLRVTQVCASDWDSPSGSDEPPHRRVVFSMSLGQCTPAEPMAFPADLPNNLDANLTDTRERGGAWRGVTSSASETGSVYRHCRGISLSRSEPGIVFVLDAAQPFEEGGLRDKRHSDRIPSVLVVDIDAGKVLREIPFALKPNEKALGISDVPGSGDVVVLGSQGLLRIDVSGSPASRCELRRVIDLQSSAQIRNRVCLAIAGTGVSQR